MIESGHLVAAHPLASAVDELGGQPPVANGLPGLLMDEADLLGEDLVVDRS